MTDMRTKPLHMIFDMADRETSVYIASPYNIFIDPYRKMIETGLSFFGLIEVEEHKRYPTSDKVNEHFPHLEVAPLYILKASIERLPPAGVNQLLGELAQQTGLPNHNLKVWSDDLTEEPAEKSKEALLSHQPGEHPDEKMLSAEENAALHGPKRIAAIMAELDRTDKEKYGDYATTTFAASSSALKEMFNKPFRKGVYQCKAVGGEIFVEQRLEEATDIKYLRTKAEVQELVDDTKHRSMLENSDYQAVRNSNIFDSLIVMCQRCFFQVDTTQEPRENMGAYFIPLSQTSITGVSLRKLQEEVSKSGKWDEYTVTMRGGKLFVAFLAR